MKIFIRIHYIHWKKLHRVSPDSLEGTNLDYTARNFL